MTHPRFRLSPPLPRKARAEDRTSEILLSPLQVLTAVFAIGSEGKKNLGTTLVRHPTHAKVAHSGVRTWRSDWIPRSCSEGNLNPEALAPRSKVTQILLEGGLS